LLHGSAGLSVIRMGNFRDILVDRKANTLISDFVRTTVR
jgi:hypothetical protein